MHALALLVALASTLVLQSGKRIVADGPVREERGRLTFRVAGVLYSLPAEEVVRVETPDESEDGGAPVKRLRVSEAERKRLLEELANNHSGTAPAPRDAAPAPPPPTPSASEVKEARREESAWRREARTHEENVRRALEELDLLEQRIGDLRWKIQNLVSLGYRPHQFTYDTTQLAFAEQQMPHARLEVERAQRAYEQFREDARREGVMPGWLR